jgi:hypothetical protein
MSNAAQPNTPLHTTGTPQAEFDPHLACLHGTLPAGQTSLTRISGAACIGACVWLEALPSAPVSDTVRCLLLQGPAPSI